MKTHFPKVTPILTRINQQLRKAGLNGEQEVRLVRGRGYYYVSGVAVSSMLTVFWLDNTSESDYNMARNHVNEVLAHEGLNVVLV